MSDKTWTIVDPTPADLDMPDCSSAPDPAGDEYDPNTDSDNTEASFAPGESA